MNQEFVLSIEHSADTHHHYRGPEIRSNTFVHLLSSEPGSGIDRLLDNGDDHATLNCLRDREWWGDQGADSDELVIDGQDVVSDDIAGKGDRVIALFASDSGEDGETDLSSQMNRFRFLPFRAGANIHMPAADPPEDTIEIESRPRGGDGVSHDFVVPNWPSSNHRISVYLPDHIQRW